MTFRIDEALSEAEESGIHIGMGLRQQVYALMAEEAKRNAHDPKVSEMRLRDWLASTCPQEEVTARLNGMQRPSSRAAARYAYADDMLAVRSTAKEI